MTIEEHLDLADKAWNMITEPKLSLNPEQRFAHSPSQIWQSYEDLCLQAKWQSNTCEQSASATAEVMKVVIEHWGGLVESIHVNFAANIFWDLDAMMGSLFCSASANIAEAAINCIKELNRGFGSYSPIRFRYAHDFLYGFDWERWVTKDLDGRSHVGPFAPDFLDYLEQRRGEIVAAIARDDFEFPKLTTSFATPTDSDGEAFRNPFSFSREPSKEMALHEQLAKLDKIPVRAWLINDRADWSRSSNAFRREVADAL